MKAIALVFAGVAAALIIYWLVRRPALTGTTKIWLLFALGVLPIGTAMSGNVASLEVTRSRTFCGSCHLMEPYTNDAADAASTTLAALHSRNRMFGDESCHGCHADYGAFGGVTTKLTGLRHMYRGYTRDDQEPLALYRPFPNGNCMQCHSTTLPGWSDEPEHQAVADDVRSGATSCASEGCHGPVHPFGKAAPGKVVSR